jgi:SAM-dependent methyltransferase
MTGEVAPPGVDPDVPSPARLYDYYLGGTHNYQADRDAAERVRALVPELSEIAWANRGFHRRAAMWIARQGIGQFIDIGAGLPTVGNTHEVVQEVNPAARVAYVDNDPVVLAHAVELLAGNPNATLIEADLRDPDSLLDNDELRALIDFTAPVGLLMTFVIHFVPDSQDPWGLVRRYIDALAPGSYLALSHGTADHKPTAAVQTGLELYAKSTQNLHLRSKADVRRFFEGLELVPPYPGADPAVVHVGVWGAEEPMGVETDGSSWSYGAVARLP